MSIQLTAINSALSQLLGGEWSGVELFPLQTLDKSLPGNCNVLWFTLCKQSESYSRVLSLHFDRVKEASYRNTEYADTCQQRIIEAIQIFWDGIASETMRIVSIP